MKQKSIAGQTTGSFINYLMGNNSTVPEVGKGATLLSWTDRHAYEVIEVLDRGKRVKMRQYIAERTDNNGMSENQSYKYEKLCDYVETFMYRYGSWHRVENIDERHKIYTKVNILFGVKDEYYDYSF